MILYYNIIRGDRSMKDIIKIDRLNFDYKKNIVFKNLSLNIKEGSFTTVLGLNGSGKTTLIKLILGLVRGNAVVIYDGLPVTADNLKSFRREIGVVYDNMNQNFVAETVKDEIPFTLENINMPREDIEKRVNEISNKLKIKKILEENPYSLNANDKWLVSLASALIINPKILIIDNGFSGLNYKTLENVLKVLSEYKEKGMTILCATNNVEEALYGDAVIVLDSGKVILNGSVEDVFKEEEVLDEIGIELPFVVSLSSKLKLYNLLKENYYSLDKLVDALWK